jgi:ubiquinone biosynthesis protein COQ9
MTERPKSETDHIDETLAKLVAAAVPHVTFDGWSPETLAAAVNDTKMDETLVAAACPRGAIDLAVAYHKQGDSAMIAAMAITDQSDMRYSERVALGVRLRLEAVPDKEAVRRGMAMFALPMHAAEGTRLIWGTADAIWNTLGDTSEDFNWYSKRTILSGVYSSTILYWLGDESTGHSDTWEFLDRRIENVMQFEKAKARMSANPLVERLISGPAAFFAGIKAPTAPPPSDLPGYWSND